MSHWTRTLVRLSAVGAMIGASLSASTHAHPEPSTLPNPGKTMPTVAAPALAAWIRTQRAGKRVSGKTLAKAIAAEAAKVGATLDPADRWQLRWAYGLGTQGDRTSALLGLRTVVGTRRRTADWRLVVASVVDDGHIAVRSVHHAVRPDWRPPLAAGDLDGDGQDDVLLRYQFRQKVPQDDGVYRLRYVIAASKHAAVGAVAIERSFDDPSGAWGPPETRVEEPVSACFTDLDGTLAMVRVHRDTHASPEAETKKTLGYGVTVWRQLPDGTFVTMPSLWGIQVGDTKRRFSQLYPAWRTHNGVKRGAPALRKTGAVGRCPGASPGFILPLEGLRTAAGVPPEGKGFALVTGLSLAQPTDAAHTVLRLVPGTQFVGPRGR